MQTFLALFVRRVLKLNVPQLVHIQFASFSVISFVLSLTMTPLQMDLKKLSLVGGKTTGECLFFPFPRVDIQITPFPRHDHEIYPLQRRRNGNRTEQNPESERPTRTTLTVLEKTQQHSRRTTNSNVFSFKSIFRAVVLVVVGGWGGTGIRILTLFDNLSESVVVVPRQVRLKMCCVSFCFPLTHPQFIPLIIKSPPQTTDDNDDEAPS